MGLLGFQVVVLGVGMVALVLGFLVVATSILGNIVDKSSKKTMLSHAHTNINNDTDVSNDTIVAITAAIYSIMSMDKSDKSDLDFVVRSIKRI